MADKAESEEFFSYETKCRKCGNFMKWGSIPKRKDNVRYFQEAMYSQVQEPRSYLCTHCDQSTVQDVVAYDPPYISDTD